MQLKFSPRDKFPGRGPCIQLYGDWVTVKVWEAVSLVLSNNLIASPVYKARQKATAFFQGGYDNAEGKWILIECWASEAECADFLKILNYQVHLATDLHKTCIRVIETDLDELTVSEICNKIAKDTDCRMDENVLHTKAVFYPQDNITYETVAFAVDSARLRREHWRDEWEDENGRSLKHNQKGRRNGI